MFDTSVDLSLLLTARGMKVVVLIILYRCDFADKFQHYNLGRNKNLEKYGQPEPPEYDLRKVTSPVVLYYSKNDKVVDSGVSRLSAYIYLIFISFKCHNFMTTSSTSNLMNIMNELHIMYIIIIKRYN